MNCVDVHAKPTNSFTLAIPKRALTNFLKGLHSGLEEYVIQMKNLIFKVLNTKTI